MPRSLAIVALLLAPALAGCLAPAPEAPVEPAAAPAAAAPAWRDVARVWSAPAGDSWAAFVVDVTPEDWVVEAAYAWIYLQVEGPTATGIAGAWRAYRITDGTLDQFSTHMGAPMIRVGASGIRATEPTAEQFLIVIQLAGLESDSTLRLGVVREIFGELPPREVDADPIASGVGGHISWYSTYGLPFIGVGVEDDRISVPLVGATSPGAWRVTADHRVMGPSLISGFIVDGVFIGANANVWRAELETSSGTTSIDGATVATPLVTTAPWVRASGAHDAGVAMSFTATDLVRASGSMTFHLLSAPLDVAAHGWTVPPTFENGRKQPLEGRAVACMAADGGVCDAHATFLSPRA